MFSATFAEAVREVAKWFAKDPVHLTIGGTHAPTTLPDYSTHPNPGPNPSLTLPPLPVPSLAPDSLERGTVRIGAQKRENIFQRPRVPQCWCVFW